MNHTEIFKKIGVIISELSEQHHFLTENPGNINEFELELLRANAHFLSDHIDILQKLTRAGVNAAGPTDKQPAQAPPQEAEVPPAKEWVFHTGKAEADEAAENANAIEPPPAIMEEEPVTRHFLDVEPEEEEEPDEEPVGELDDADEDAEEPGPMEPETPAEPETQPVPETEPEKTPEPIMTPEPSEEPVTVVNEVVIEEKTVDIVLPADSSTRAVPTVNDLLSAAAAASQRTVSGQLAKPVSDLKTAINLNDKLLFVKDLFNGYSLAYSEAIDLAGKAGSFDAAKKFLETTYSAKNNWSAKQATVEKFYGIIGQRFGY